MGFSRRLAALVTGAAFVAGSALVATPGIAAAEADQGHGYTIHPAQPTQDNPDSYEWVGSYVVNGKQVWCVDYMYKAPDSDEEYEPGDTLQTKWGDPLPADDASQISYMLLRYGDTTDDDRAAALAYWMHTWTAPITDADGTKHPTSGVDDHKKLAYDPDFHKENLPAAAQQAIDDMLTDAKANHGPWTGKVTAPEQDQTIGKQGTWTVQVLNASGEGLADVPVTVTASGATLAKPDEPDQPDGSAQNVDQAAADSGEQDAGVTVTTGEDGTATVLVTPKRQEPKVTASFASPNETPTVKKPLEESTQKIVLTGGEKTVTTSTVGSAKPKPSPTPSTTTVTVPVHIPAGGSAADVQATAATTTQARPGMLIGFGALLLAGAGAASLVVARRLRHRSR